MITHTLPETGYVRLSAILKVFPIGKSTWWAKVKAGEYPPPVKLGPRTTAWRVEDIRVLLQKTPNLQKQEGTPHAA
jgi:predicted DNA-binding transcriptional regulator AlpA